MGLTFGATRSVDENAFGEIDRATADAADVDDGHGDQARAANGSTRTRPSWMTGSRATAPTVKLRTVRSPRLILLPKPNRKLPRRKTCLPDWKTGSLARSLHRKIRSAVKFRH